jgi:DNA-binding IclR family transcriptional regulator
LQDILELLCDGNCHSLYELQVGAQLSESQTRAAVEFLTEYGFAEMTDHDQKVRISNTARKLLEKT